MEMHLRREAKTSRARNDEFAVASRIESPVFDRVGFDLIEVMYADPAGLHVPRSFVRLGVGIARPSDFAAARVEVL
jgi:hypothetical protein